MNPAGVMRLGLLLLGSSVASAAVTHVEIQRREPYADGLEFPGVGPYERWVGKVHFALDPQSRANLSVVDLSLAPRNDRGEVEFSADLEILAPADPSRSNGTLLYDVNASGDRQCLDLFNAGADHFLMRRGYVVCWSGWIGETLPGGGRLLMDAPIAQRGVTPIVGMVRAEMSTDIPVSKMNVANRAAVGSPPPTLSGRKQATLTWRLREQDQRVLVPREQWRLDDEYVEADGRRSLLPKVELTLSGGFQPGYLYELIYEARHPIVQGCGLAGIRDLVSFLKRDSTPRNPWRIDSGEPIVQRALGFGFSQGGRGLRTLLREGFNADEAGRKVFDGMAPLAAGAGVGSFNHRFASPSRQASQHVGHL
ncbi:MAG: hypothetical protein N2C14_15305, partial [Planctomycetales bacterium]